MKEAESMDLLLDLDSDNKNNLGGGGGGGGMNITEPPGFKGFPQIPMVPSADFQLFNSKFPVSINAKWYFQNDIDKSSPASAQWSKYAEIMIGS